MSRELWAVEPLLVLFVVALGLFYAGYLIGRYVGFQEGYWCEHPQRPIDDFDAIWDRYYETADRRFESGLTYNELWYVVTGQKEEEE